MNVLYGYVFIILDGLPARDMRKKNTKNKKYHIQSDVVFDLHGMSVLEAQSFLSDEIHRLRNTNASRIRVITGKGNHSEHNFSPVRDGIKSLLNSMGLDYTYAKIQDGGEGALEVRLR